MSLYSYARLESRSLLRLSGKDAEELLQNIVTNDLELLKSNSALFSALLTPQGKFLHDFIIIKDGNVFYIDVLKERQADLARRLTMYKLRADVKIEDASGDYSIIALFSEDGSLPQAPQADGGFAFEDPRLKKLGLRFLIPASADLPSVFDSATEVSEALYMKHRLKLGVPEGGLDIEPEKNFLLEVNFEELNAISFSKGCYIGQELTARTKHRAKIRKRLFQFESKTSMSVGDSIKVGDKEIAKVHSFQSPYGLAMTRLDALDLFSSASDELTPSDIQLNKPDYVILPENDD